MIPVLGGLVSARLMHGAIFVGKPCRAIWCIEGRAAYGILRQRLGKFSGSWSYELGACKTVAPRFFEKLKAAALSTGMDPPRNISRSDDVAANVDGCPQGGLRRREQYTGGTPHIVLRNLFAREG